MGVGKTKLSRAYLVAQGDRFAAERARMALPERVVQFGTGVFLRGFIEVFIDRANAAGHYGGRVVAVGSTGSGRVASLHAQEGLYTVVTQGLQDGEPVDEARLVTSLSRALSAATQWPDVLACAASPTLDAIVSNTTEVGLRLDPTDHPERVPPTSFPGKLTAFLRARALAFDHDPAFAPVVLPCELLEGNGDRLRGLVETLARQWYDAPAFARWLGHVRFCNTLVDRIVPGTPTADKHAALTRRLGYHDALLLTAEPYRLWAVEGDEALVERLPFLKSDGVVVAADITPYRTRKVRILNGAHTAMVPVGLQYGLRTVREATADPAVGRFLRTLVRDEIVPTLDVPGAAVFAEAVLERFANPFIDHQLRDIMLQATMKARVRVLPSLRSYAQGHHRLPPALTLAFALALLIRRDDTPDAYPPDDQAETLRAAWQRHAPAGATPNPARLRALVGALLADESLWDADLTAIPGLAEAITTHLTDACRHGVPATLDALVTRLPQTP